MIRSVKQYRKEESTGRIVSGVKAENRLTLKWTYNYFSIESDISRSDWRENLPEIVKKALNDGI